MSSPSRRERRRARQKKEQARIWGGIAGIIVALIPSIVPRLPSVIVTVLVVVWLASYLVARNGYRYHLPFKWVVGIMLIHGALLVILGYVIWPRITVSPSHVSFQGYPGETFNFSVKNGRFDDVYDVEVPFLIGYGKYLQDKIAAKVITNGDPQGPLSNDYSYCFGVKGDGVPQHVQPNEREVLIVNIKHILPYGFSSFSVTFAGGDKFDAKQLESPSFVGEPHSYSLNQETVGVRGDYRICKYTGKVNGMVGQ
jgi:hypothetical protein